MVLKVSLNFYPAKRRRKEEKSCEVWKKVTQMKYLVFCKKKNM